MAGPATVKVERKRSGTFTRSTVLEAKSGRATIVPKMRLGVPVATVANCARTAEEVDVVDASPAAAVRFCAFVGTTRCTNVASGAIARRSTKLVIFWERAAKRSGATNANAEPEVRRMATNM